VSKGGGGKGGGDGKEGAVGRAIGHGDRVEGQGGLKGKQVHPLKKVHE